MEPSRYPGESWDRIAPEAVGFDPGRLAAVGDWLAETANGERYRVIVVRHGAIVAEWNAGSKPGARLSIASAAKSLFSSVLGIVLAEGTLASADVPLVEVYPEAMEVSPGQGPKENRYAFEKDQAVTFRQLISNTSGYMKPDEQPGRAFHYQTYGMNVLTHAIAKLYGLYDVANPVGSPGLAPLVTRWIRDPIGADWRYEKRNFDLRWAEDDDLPDASAGR